MNCTKVRVIFSRVREGVKKRMWICYTISMRHFYLIRHTEYENPRHIFHGRLSFQLTQDGRERALAIARKMRRKKIGKIYSSAVQRCKEMSEVLSSVLKVPIAYDTRLLEILTAVQGVDLAEYEQDRNMRFSLVSTLGGERMMDIQVRMLDFFY